MIVVEGPDGTGKTSLVNSLKNMTGYQVASKAVESSMTGVVNLPDYIERALRLGFHTLIYDRFALISGPIYGPICGMGGTVNEFLKDHHQLEDWFFRFRKLDPLIIYCLPPERVVHDNIVKSQPDEVVEHWREIYWAYRAKVAADSGLSGFRVYLYDYTIRTPHQVSSWISAYLSGLEPHA